MYLQEFSNNDIFRNILKVYPKFHFRIQDGKTTVNNLPIELYSVYMLEIKDRPIPGSGDFNFSEEGNPLVGVI